MRKVFSLTPDFRYADALKLKAVLHGMGLDAGETEGGLAVYFEDARASELMPKMRELAHNYKASLDDEAFSVTFKNAWREEHGKGGSPKTRVIVINEK
jgi:hypothetical protein